MREDRERWEARYAKGDNHLPEPASLFLQQQLARIPRGRALDLACGSGRQAMFLASNGFTVDAVDIAMGGLRRVQRAARRQDLPVRLIQADLDAVAFADEHYALVVNVRFLNRQLWSLLKRCVRPSGFVLFETFTIDQAAIGHPSNPDFLLRHGELRDAFADFDVLSYQEGLFETESEPTHLARLLAQRPIGWDPR